MITPEYPPVIGGVGGYVNKLSLELVERGFKVSVITRGGWKGSVENPTRDLKIYRTPYIPLYPFNLAISKFFISRTLKKIEKEVDVVHVHTPGPMCVSTKVPIIATVHVFLGYVIKDVHVTDMRSLVTKLVSPFYIRMEDQLLRNVQTISAVSESVSARMKIKYPDMVVKVIYNGVDTNLFKPATSIFDKKDLYILYTGRLDSNKGVQDLIKAFAIFSKKCPQIKLILAGRGPYERYLRNMIKTQNIKNVIFKGFVLGDELIQLYQNASIYVLPSYSEGLPTSLLEAMSCGLPCVVTNVDGSKDVVNDGANGLLVPPRDPIMLADAIITLLDDEESRKRLGTNARRHITSNYDWEIIAEGIEEVYKMALLKPKGGQ